MYNAAGHIDTWNRFRAGDQTAMLALYNEHYLGLVNYGIRVMASREFTIECITQLFLKLWDGRHRLPPVDNVRSYLLTSLRNELLAELRRENARLSRNVLIAGVADRSVHAYDEMLVLAHDDAELKKKLEAAFRKLTDREKELMRMKFYDDLDYDQIAEKCAITKRTAYNIIYAAVKSLKAEFRSGVKLKKVSGPVRLPVTLLLYMGTISHFSCILS